MATSHASIKSCVFKNTKNITDIATSPAPVTSITSVVSLPNQPDVVQARFESIAPGMSKAKYWVKISKILAERAGAIEAAAASAAALEVALAADEPAA